MASDKQPITDLPPHVLIFPFPALSHTNTMLNLAELLCLAFIDVTFIISDFNHNRLLQHSTIHSRFSNYPAFRFQTISDGLPDDHPRAGDRVLEMFSTVINVTGPLFKKMMVDRNYFGSATRRQVTCIIADGLLSFAGEFAEQRGIPLVYFRLISGCSIWACYCFEELIEADEIPVKGNGMDLLVKSVPGMEGFLRRRDLPGYCRVNDINDPLLRMITYQSKQTSKAQGAIINSFEDLEGPIISQIRNALPNLYPIGPLHAHLKSRLEELNTNSSVSSASFWEQDRTCIDWLDSQPPKSVIYVSFGSITVVTKDQLLEFWHGLVNSGQRFLWVMRPDSIEDGVEGQIPIELQEGTKARGYMVSWAPQEEILNHPTIGGFLTHSGWTSTLESICAGVPMICWPYAADQMINCRFVSEIWKIGLDIKDICDRVVVEKMVRVLMDVRRDEFLQRAKEMAALARKSVSKGGSSYRNLDCMIEYIKSLVI